MSAKTFRLVVVLVLVSILGLTSGAAQALPLSGGYPGSRLEIFAVLRDWLAGGPVAGLMSLLTKEGSQMDPNGQPIKAGSQMDPNGNPIPPAPVVNGDEGSQMDPDGR